MRHRTVQVLTLTAFVCLFAILGRAMGNSIFDEFIYDYDGTRDRNAVLRGLYRWGGIFSGGAIGLIIQRLLIHRPPGEGD